MGKLSIFLCCTLALMAVAAEAATEAVASGTSVTRLISDQCTCTCPVEASVATSLNKSRRRRQAGNGQDDEDEDEEDEPPPPPRKKKGKKRRRPQPRYGSITINSNNGASGAYSTGQNSRGGWNNVQSYGSRGNVGLEVGDTVAGGAISYDGD